jgi:hypothetical protein
MVLHLLANEVGPGLRVGQHLSIKASMPNDINLLCEWCDFVVCQRWERSSGGPTRHLNHQRPTWAAGASRNFQTSGLSPVLRTEAMMNKPA